MQYRLGLILLLLCSPLWLPGLTAQSCEGLWKVILDKSNEPACIMQLYQKEGLLYGRMRKILKSDTKQADPKCVNCTDDRYNQRVIGMDLIRGLKRRGDLWSGGKLLDPHTGRQYKCYLELLEPDRLKVRGYVGFSLIGRTQYWHRVDAMALD